MNLQPGYIVIEEAYDSNLLHVRKSFLESEGIQSEVLHDSVARAEGLFATGPFRAQLIVRGDQADEAVRLLQAFE